MLTREIGELEVGACYGCRRRGIGASFTGPEVAGLWDEVLEFGKQVGRDALASARDRLAAMGGNVGPGQSRFPIPGQGPVPAGGGAPPLQRLPTVAAPAAVSPTVLAIGLVGLAAVLL